MGNFMMNAMFFAPSFGLIGAIETFVSQAYGHGNFQICSEYLYKSRLVLTLYFLICLIFFLHSDQILEALRQDKHVAKYA